MTTGFTIDGLGVRRVVNAGAAQSRLGGSTLAPPVREAMDAAARVYVDVEELHDRVGEQIAALTGNEAAAVVAGSAAGIMIAVAALMAGDDPAAAAALPQRRGTRPAVAVWRAHLDGMLAGTEERIENSYVNGVYQAGARIRVADGPDDVREDDLCMLWFPNMYLDDDEATVRRAVASSHAAGVPLIVDAADQVPPVANLSRFTRELGADLAIFSGGKGLGGPTSSGLVLGRADLVRACRVNSGTEHGVGRPAKVGREELAGLLVAVREALAVDEDARFSRWSDVVADWHASFRDEESVEALRTERGHCGQRIPRLLLRLRSGSRECRDRIVADLWEEDPRVAVLPAAPAALALSPQLLEAGEPELVAATVATRVAEHRSCGDRCTLAPPADVRAPEGGGTPGG